MSGVVRIGQRVWVAHEGGLVHGRVAALSDPLLGGPAGFVVLIDGTPPTVITCDEALRGTQWDFAPDADAV